MRRLSAATFDRFIRSLVVIAILLATFPMTRPQVASASARPRMPNKPAQLNVAPPLPIMRHKKLDTPQPTTHAVATSEYRPRNSVLAASTPTTTLAVQLTAEIGQHSIPYSEWYKPFYSTTVTFEYHSGRVKLAARSDGGGAFVVDDQVLLKVTHPDGSIATYIHDFCQAGCVELSNVDLTSDFAPGTNSVYIELDDVHGHEVGAHPALWLVSAKPEDESWAGNECPICGNKARYNYLGDPINTNTGNYNYQMTDLSIATIGSTLSFERSYNAQSSSLITTSAIYSSPLGYGWTHSHDIHLTFPSDSGGESGTLILKAPHGSRIRFYTDGQGGYFASPGVPATITQTGSTTTTTFYTVTTTNQTLYRFDYLGHLVAQRDPAGHMISYTYFLTGPLQLAADSTGQRYVRFAYDTQQRLVKVTDPISRNVQFGYDANSNLTVVTDTRGLPWTYIYSGTTHLLMRVVDPDGQTVVRNEYDTQGRVIRQLNGVDQPIASLDYSDGSTTTLTDALNRTLINQYANGVWVGSTDAARNVLTRTYDLNFQPSQLADTNNHITQLTWSADGANVTRLVNASGFTTTMQYDRLNNLKQITDTRGYTTSYVYSGTLLTQQTDALGNTMIYTYGQNNLLTAQQDALGRIAQFENGTFGERKAVTVTDASGAIYSVTRYQYDPVGRLITTTDPIGRITINSYNDGDQLIAVTNNYTTASTAPNYLSAWNLITRYGYDGFGRQTAITDTLSQVTRNWYDDAGRLISVTANFSPTVGQNYSTTYNLITRYGYDAVGNRIWVTNTLMQAALTEYDNLNRPVTVTTNYKDGAFNPGQPDEDVQRITHYDPAGNVIEQIEPPSASGERRVTRTWYDALNRVFSTTVNFTTTLSADPNTYNLTTWYEYDPAGNQIAITDTAKHVTRNYYDRVGRLISTTVNYSPTLGVNALNQFNLTTRYEYDAVGNRVAITDPVTLTTRYAFDALNRLVVITQNFTITTGLDPSLYNLATRYRYDAIGNRLAVTDALTHTAVYTYDAVGRLMAEGNSVIGNVTRYQYDALGRTVVVTDPLTHTLRTYYNAAGRVVSTTNALTGTTVITYDALGRRVGVINENGKSSTTGYDGLGRTIALTDALSSVTRYGYDAVGNRVTITDPLTHTTAFTYDIAGRLIAQRDAMTNTTRYGYDGLGNRLVVTDANGIATGYGYDALNRLSVVTESLTTTLGLDATRYNITTTYGYDAIGNRTMMTNARGYTTTYGYDVLSRLISLRDPLGSTTRYRYDAVGNRVAMTDALTQTTAYRYDELNRVLAITYTTGMSNVVYAYDKVGNRTSMTDAVGTTRYGYDALNRPISITDALTSTMQYRYDAVGNRTHLIYPDGKVVTYTFDAANRLTATLSWDGQRTTYQFDKAGRLLTTTLPNQLRLVNAYDDAGRLWNLTQWGANWQLAAYTYTLDAIGNRIAVVERVLPPTPLDYLPLIMNTYSDTQEMLLQGDLDSPFVSPLPAPDDTTSPFVSPLSSSSRPSDTASQSGAAKPWPDPSLWVSAAIALAAIVALRKNGRKWAWPIALLAGTVVAMSAPQPGRGAAPQPRPFLSPQSEPAGCTLPTASGDTRVISYTYDPLSRLTSAVYSSGECYQYAYDRVGNRTVQTTTVGAITYQYDAANRLSSVNGQTYAWDNTGNLLNDGSALYRYDQANRLISTTLSGVTSLYAYTGDGVRLKQTVAGVPTTYTQDLAAPLPVVMQAKTGVTTTRYLYDISTRPLAQYTSDGAEYLLADGLGSVRQIADANGYLILTQDYEPYGSVRNSDGLRGSAYGFTGEERDTTGLIYLRARYMQPMLGMFLSRDPWSGDDLRPASMNGWNYVEENPVNRVDPSGLSPWIPTDDDGRIIHHQLIEPDFEIWGAANGYFVRTEVAIEGASKKGTGRDGFADLLDITHRMVYDIKPLGSGIQAMEDALWYRDRLNQDSFYSQFRPWQAGTLYLREVGLSGKEMGIWPGYPNYSVWAGFFAPGAIVYWGKRNSPDPDLFPKIIILSRFCEELLKQSNRRLGVPEGGLVPVPNAVTITNFDAHSTDPFFDWLNNIFNIKLRSCKQRGLTMPGIKFKHIVLRSASILIAEGYQPSKSHPLPEIVQFWKEPVAGVLCNVEFQLRPHSFPPVRSFEIELRRTRLPNYPIGDSRYTPLIGDLPNLLWFVYKTRVLPIGQHWEFADEQSLQEQVMRAQVWLRDYCIKWLEDPQSKNFF